MPETNKNTGDADNNTTPPKVAACSKCNVALVPIQKKAAVSAAGILGLFLILIGIVTLLFNVPAGLAIIIIAVIISMAGRSSKTVMTCPQCGQQGVTL